MDLAVYVFGPLSCENCTGLMLEKGQNQGRISPWTFSVMIDTFGCHQRTAGQYIIAPE